MSKFKGTYILERSFILRYDENVISKLFTAIIRPCSTSYEIVRNVIKNCAPNESLILNGAIEVFEPGLTTISFHEWLIDISLNKNIVPDIEKHICVFPKENPPWGKEHIMMEKDCHTNEILYVHPNYKDWPSRVNKILDI